MRGSKMLLETLIMHDVQHIFGLPGDTTMSFYDDLYDCEAIQHIMCRDERSAGHMADAYARVSGKPGVTEAPSGAGATYVLPAAAEADGSCIPLVVLTSDVSRTSEDRAAITALEQRDVFLPVTRYSRRVSLPQMIPHTVRTAFRAATGGRMGAAHVGFPEDVLSAEVDHEAAGEKLYLQRAYSHYPAQRVRPDADWVEQAAEKLLEAERPLVLAGGGVLLSAAECELLHLAEALSLGVVTTMDGKGAIPEDHPLALGVIGGNGGKDASNGAVGEADVVLAVGTQLSSTSTFGGALLGHGPTLIHVDIDPDKLGNNAPVELPIEADARLFFADLLQACVPTTGDDDMRWNRWIIEKKERVTREMAAIEGIQSENDGQLHPIEMVRGLRRTLPPDATVICDPGTPTPFMMAYYPITEPGKRIFAARSQGGLGYALPAALGVSTARPGAPAVAMVGDGSMGMCIGELETLAREGEQIIVIHTRNDTYGWIKNLQKLYYGGRYFSVDFDNDVDYVAAARAFGAEAHRVENVRQFEIAVQKALERNLTVIEISTPPATEVTPPVAPWRRDERLPEEQRIRKSY